MERRTFLSIVSGAGLAKGVPPEGGLVLTAIAAERLPQTVILHNPPHWLADGVLEVREYEGGWMRPELLIRHGVQIIATERSALLLWFGDLTVRDACWSSLT